MTGRRIGANEFRNLAIFERDDASGPVYSIVFDQREFLKGGAPGWFRFLIAFVAMGSGCPVFLGVISEGERLGKWTLVVLGLLALGYMALFHWLLKPVKVRRAVELDMGRGRLRVLKKGRVEIEREFSGAEALTVEDHPDAEYKRQRRQEDGKKSLSNEEMQHCLIGWFGARGSEQVILLSRAEWPNRKSLLEVREAILWAFERAAGRIASAAGAPPEPQTGSGIKPPLD